MDPTIQAILDSIHSFYSTAWSQLVIFTTALLAFVGVIVPVMSQWYQRRAASVDRKELEALLKEQVVLAHQELKDSLSEQQSALQESLQNDLTEVREHATRSIQGARGATFHVQGNSQIRQNLYDDALVSLIASASGYLKAKDEGNLGRVLGIIETTCIPKITREQLKMVLVAGDSLKKLLDDLREGNTDGRYTDAITGITKARLLAEKREAAQPTKE